MTPPLRWRLGVAGGVALVVLLVDQLTKLAVRAVGDALHVTVIPGVIDFLFVRNIGAAFSMGEGHGIAFAVLALAVIIAIAVYLVRAPQLAHLEVVGMAMVAGGAIGNAIDRLAFGFVTDFIATTFIDFPVFNVADIGITMVDGKSKGDVDAASVEPVAGWLTPMPRGTGPMTRAMLMYNTVLAAENAAAGR